MSSPLFEDSTPEEVKHAEGLHLITQNTPNGQKIQIMLEELNIVYGLRWTTSFIDISTNEQKKDWFLRLNPNGRIPILLDRHQSSSHPFPVMETSAELLYLHRFYDINKVFGFRDELEISEALQWLFFWHGSGAPYFGQAHHFVKYAKEKIPYAIERYTNETLRVIGVLEIRLSGKFASSTDNKDEPPHRDYLVGKDKGKYSIADIGTWPWVQHLNGPMFTDEHRAQFPHVLKWIDRIAAREAVQKGIGEKYDIPKEKEKEEEKE